MNSPFKAAIFRTAQAMRGPQRKPHSAVFSGDASRKRAKYDHILVSILYDKREHEKHLVAHNFFYSVNMIIDCLRHDSFVNTAFHFFTLKKYRENFFLPKTAETNRESPLHPSVRCVII